MQVIFRWPGANVAVIGLVLALTTAEVLAATIVPPASGGPSCPGCSLKGKDFNGQSIVGGNFANADLAGANFAGATLEGVVFTGADLSGATFVGATIKASSGTPTSFVAANLTGANFTKAMMAGPTPQAKLQYANLAGANFTGADLTGAAFGDWSALGAGSQAANFQDAILGCGLAAHVDTFGATGAKLPTGCPSKPAAQAAGPAAWQCPNTTLAGFTSFVYVAPPGTDGASCGTTAQTACRNIAQAVKQCIASGCAVLAAYGAYPVAANAPISLASGSAVFGGCLATTPEPTDFSLVLAPAGGVPALVANGVKNATVQGLEIMGSSATSPGQPSVAVSLSNGASVVFTDVGITGGLGAPGAPGTPGTSGAPGSAASGQTGGTSSCNAAGGNGGAGETNIHGSHSCSKVTQCQYGCSSSYASCAAPQNGQGSNGGSSGANTNGQCLAGTNAVTYCPTSSLNGTNAASDSGSGACGANGAPSGDTAGLYANGVWSPAAGGNGTAGANGSGGGGGGGGGACSQLKGTACAYNQFYFPAANGGGGGGGGCGSGLGTGGQQGGASIAMQLTAAHVQLNSVQVVSGPGGPGGNGGRGGAPSSGGAGATGSSAQQIATPRQELNTPFTYTSGGNGGNGAHGGLGGGGGGGAGGNGGPSFAIMLDGASAIDASAPGYQAPIYYAGSSGAVGAAGGTAPSGLFACPAPTNSDGLPGTVQTVKQF